MTFTSSDERGVILRTGRCNRGHACILVTTTHGQAPVCVPEEELPRFTASLYEQAGLEVPLLLPRMPQDHLDQTGRWRSWSGSNLTLTRHGPGIRLELSAPAHELSAGTARQLASALATFAGDADDEPDPQAVKALLRLITESGVPARDAEELARKLTRAGVTVGGAS